jgi:hypothetical protein
VTAAQYPVIVPRAAQRGISVQTMKPIIGLFVAPILGAFLGTVSMVVVSGVEPNQILSVLFVYTLVGSVIGVVIAIFLGWPLFQAYKFFGMYKIWQYAIGGVLCALPFWALWFYPFNTGHWAVYRYVNTFYFFSVGIFSAIAFWFFVVRKMHTNKQLNSDSGAIAPPPVS